MKVKMELVDGERLVLPDDASFDVAAYASKKYADNTDRQFRLDPLHVIVKFGKDIPGSIQGPALLDFERKLRELAPGIRAEVFKDHMGDDSKLRSQMTPQQRASL